MLVVAAALVLKKPKNLYEIASTPTWRKIETQPLRCQSVAIEYKMTVETC